MKVPPVAIALFPDASPWNAPTVLNKSSTCVRRRSSCRWGSARTGRAVSASSWVREVSMRASRVRWNRRSSWWSSARRSAASGTTISPDSEGVSALRSATRSLMLTSTSWPTALIIGIGLAAMARATTSSLKGHKSSRLPPPRPTIATSTPSNSGSSRIPRAIFSAAPSP